MNGSTNQPKETAIVVIKWIKIPPVPSGTTPKVYFGNDTPFLGYFLLDDAAAASLVGTLVYSIVTGSAVMLMVTPADPDVIADLTIPSGPYTQIVP